MTVSELIEELQKFPGHHTVMLETYAEDGTNGHVELVLDWIGQVRAHSNMWDTGPTVRIVAEGQSS